MDVNRRDFVQLGAATSGLLLLKPQTAFGYAANSAVRLGLLGCGSRGTAVASSFARNTETRVVALADLFPDQLIKSKAYFDALHAELGVQPIDSKLMFRGYEAFEELASSPDIDAIQISTPPWFHVQHLDAAVSAGKHVYCEKPLGVDVAQASHALEIGKRAAGRVSLDVGFQVRSAPPIAEIAGRIQGGALGKIACIEAHYNAPAAVSHEGAAWSPAESRLRNWLWDRTLSGDIIVEQNIHIIDLCNWMLQGKPLKALARGGRNATMHAGDTWDNYHVIYTYPGDVRVSFSSKQFGSDGTFDAAARLFGSDGTAEVPYAGPVRIIGKDAWEWEDAEAQPDEPDAQFAANGAFLDNLRYADREKDRSFITSITSGRFHNQAVSGVESALSCMLARMAGQTGREVTWEELLKHGETYHLDINMQQFS
jgi:predicted dehydrogenase